MGYKVGEVLLEIKADTAKLITGMEKAERTIKSTVDRAKKALLGIAAAYASIEGIRGFSGMIHDAIDAADATGKLAEKLGITTDGLSKLQYAASFAGIEMGKLEAGLSAMIRRTNNFVRDGGGAAAKALRELGISAEFARKHFTDTETTFRIIAERLAQLPDGYRKTAIAQDIFSKSAADMLRVANLGSEGLQELYTEAEKAGVVISAATAKMAGDYNDTIERIEARIEGMKQTFASGFMPTALAAARTVEDAVKEMFLDSSKAGVEFGETSADVFTGLIKTVGFFKDSLTGIKIVLKSIEWGFLKLVELIGESFNYVTDKFNTVISWYNSLPEWLVGKHEPIKLYSKRDLSGLRQWIKDVENDISSLTNSITQGRSEAELFVEKFKKYLQEAHESAKDGGKEFASTYKSTLEKINSSLRSLGASGKRGADDLQKTLQQKHQAYLEYLRSTGKEFELWALQEGEKLRKLYEAGLDSDKLQEVYEADYKKFLERGKKAAADMLSLTQSATGGMRQIFEQNFFDYMTGRFKSFKDFFKNILNDILSNLITPFAKSLSGLISGAISGAFGGARGGIVNYASFFSAAPATMNGDQLLEWLGGANVGSGAATLPNGQTISLDTYTQIANVAAGGNLQQAFDLLGYGRNLYGFASGGVQSLLYAPAMGVAQIGTYLQGIPLVGGTLSQGAYGFSTLLAGGNPGIYGTAGTVGAALGAGAIGYLGGKTLDKLFGADTKAGEFAAIGAALGSLAGPVGALAGGALGGLIGGLFGKTKVTGSASGVDIFGYASADYAAGRYWTRTDYKKKSWFSSKSWSEWNYKGFGDKEIEAIKKAIGTFDQLLWMMGDFGAELQVKGGRFKSIEDFLSKNVVKAFLQEAMDLGPLTETITTEVTKKLWLFGKDTVVKVTKTVLTEDGRKLNEIYDVWADYAKSINKKIYEAFTDVVNDYVNTQRGFEEWYLQFKGRTLDLYKFKLETAQQDLDLIKRMIGEQAANVTIDNYLEAYRQAVKDRFTPEVIEEWKQLGEALKQVSEAERAYQEALAGQSGTIDLLSGRYDMLMGRVIDASRTDVGAIVQEIRDGNTDMKLLFVEILKELKRQTAIEQGLVP